MKNILYVVLAVLIPFIIVGIYIAYEVFGNLEPQETGGSDNNTVYALGKLAKFIDEDDSATTLDIYRTQGLEKGDFKFEYVEVNQLNNELKPLSESTSYSDIIVDPDLAYTSKIPVYMKEGEKRVKFLDNSIDYYGMSVFVDDREAFPDRFAIDYDVTFDGSKVHALTVLPKESSKKEVSACINCAEVTFNIFLSTYDVEAKQASHQTLDQEVFLLIDRRVEPVESITSIDMLSSNIERAGYDNRFGNDLMNLRLLVSDSGDSFYLENLNLHSVDVESGETRKIVDSSELGIELSDLLHEPIPYLSVDEDVFFKQDESWFLLTDTGFQITELDPAVQKIEVANGRSILLEGSSGENSDAVYKQVSNFLMADTNAVELIEYKENLRLVNFDAEKDNWYFTDFNTVYEINVSEGMQPNTVEVEL